MKEQGSEMELAMIDSTVADVDELVVSYGFSTPAVRIFRRRIMFEFDLNSEETVRGWGSTYKCLSCTRRVIPP